MARCKGRVEIPRSPRLTQNLPLGAVGVAPHLAEGVSAAVGQALTEAGVEARLELLVDGGRLLGV